MDDWKVLARELTGWELMQRVENGHDIAILPVGSMEMHGPQLPIGTDTYIAEAVSQIAATKMNGTVFDTVSYTWPGMTKYSFPTISMTMDIETNYVRMICEQLLRIGFKRLYVIQFHGPGIPLMKLAREFFEETGTPLAFYGLMRMPDNGREMCASKHVAWEASLASAATNFLGSNATFEPDALPKDLRAPVVPGDTARAELVKTGAFIGSLGTSDLHHGTFEDKIDADIGMQIIDRMAQAISSSAKSMANLVNAWEGVELPTSYPSMKSHEHNKAMQTDARTSRR